MKTILKSVFYDLKEKFIDYIRDFGPCNIETFRQFDNEFGIPSFEYCVITKIKHGIVYYDDNVKEHIDNLSMTELYDIISKI